MAKVTAQMSVSLDGYYSGPRSSTDPHDMAARVVETPEVTHIRYVIGPRAKLELDDRGAGG